MHYLWLEVIHLPRNMGKAGALNEGLKRVRHKLTISVDGDSYLYCHALENLARRYPSDPPNTKAGCRVGFAENACLFTNAPTTMRQFIRQRQRWSRGLIEAFKEHWQMLFQLRMTTIFIWWNLLFPFMDVVYTLAFVPGLVLALFGIYWIAGPMTLFVLPMALVINGVMYRIQSRMFTAQNLKVRRNWLGFIGYSLFYGLVLQPACVVGYVQEFVTRTKRWGTK